jgi:hypothetical protein
VREELNKAENAGLKDFLINLFLWGHRIQNFLSCIATGFSADDAFAYRCVDAEGARWWSSFDQPSDILA